MNFEGLRVTVMGLGGFGGGVGVTRWLAGRGAKVLVTDGKPADKLAASVAAVNDLVRSGAVTLRLGEHRAEDFTQAGLVVANPAVPTPWANTYLAAAEAKGVPITTEIELAVSGLPDLGRVIAVTGSVGKSTTSAMIHHALTGLGERALFGGNIGGSLLGRDDLAGAWIVLELSSFMLHWLGRSGFAPGVAVATNLSPNHLDWHGSMDHYASSKMRIVANQKPGAAAILGPGLHGWWTRPGVRRAEIQPAEGVAGLIVPGRHNALNGAVARAAVLAALAPTAPPTAPLGREPAGEIEAALRTFPGLAHRLQRVGVFAGVTCFNDSKSTTPESTLLALEAMREAGGGSLARVHLIAGGYDKGSDLSPVAKLADQVAGLYTVAQTGPAIDAASGGRSIPCGDVAGAVARAFERARPGDTLLLSPACASWGQFENFERRGELFEKLVRARN